MRVRIASDHGRFVLKEHIADLLRSAGHEVVDFGALHSSPGDDYPEYVVPLGQSHFRGQSGSGNCALRQWSGGIHLRQQNCRRAR